MSGAAHVFELGEEELRSLMTAAGLEPYRARQLFEWVYHKSAEAIEDMTDLPRAARPRLAERLDIRTGRIAREQVSSDGTVKWLTCWPDGAATESVLIPDGRRRTVCVSSQAGCPVRCAFCASGMEGLERNLTAGEMVEQVWHAAAACRRGGARLSHVVFMGSGEPLANYAALLRAVRVLRADWGLNIGARRITVSTVGLPSQIRRLASEGLPVNLALSLHAPNDGLRRQLIPWAARVTLDELAEACRAYFQRTGREVTIEYILLAGVNDGVTHAEELAAFCRRVRCNVNLIRYNPVEPLPFRRPSARDGARFQAILRRRGIPTHLRKSRGRDIDAACGQLKRRPAAEVGVPLGIAAAGRHSTADGRDAAADHDANPFN